MTRTAERRRTPAAAPARRPALSGRRCACGGSPGLDGECSACRARRLARKRDIGFQRCGQTARPAPAAAHDYARVRVGPPDDRFEQEAEQTARRVVEAPRSPATEAAWTTRGAFGASTADRPLPDGLRAELEPRFGYDFRKVRLHVGSDAAHRSRSLEARAFTIGEHITFAPGEFDPETSRGRLLLAHELTHVIQQGAAPQLAAASAVLALSAFAPAGVAQRVGECAGRNGYNCNGVRCWTAAGKRGSCTWGGVTNGCNCRDQSGDEPGPSRVAEVLPAWLMFILTAAGIAAVAACLASGVCEAAALIGAAGAATAAVLIGILRAAGVNVTEGGGETA